jgi:uncharacterized protein Usg
MWLGKTRLVTAHITYRRPDHKWLLQDFVWQNYDALPDFPALVKFLRFWQTEIEGPLVAVRIGHGLHREQILTDLYDFDFGGHRPH